MAEDKLKPIDENNKVIQPIDKEVINADGVFEIFRITVDGKQSPLRIDVYLANRMDKSASRQKIQNAAKAGYILVNGKPIKPNYKVRPLDDIKVSLPRPKRRTDLIAEPIPLQIVHEDEQVLVVSKEPGMVVHPACGHESGTLVNALIYYFQNLPNPPNQKDFEYPRPGIVHRIDKDTSGLLVVAKTEHARTHLSKQFFNHTVVRRYVALVWGDLKEDSGTITGNIGRHLRYRKVMTVFTEEDKGKHAITHYKVLKRFGYVTLVECRLETGRTHQIRVHFKHIGHPLFNDSDYGGDKVVKGTLYNKYKQFVGNCFKLFPRHALHAKILGFVHPTTGEELHFDSELPRNFQQLIEKWTRYMGGR